MTTTDATPTLRHRLFNVDEYYRMRDIGILHEDDHVELLEGVLYEKYPSDGGASRPRRFTADEYQLLGMAGILHEDEHVELIAGEIVEMAAMGHRHNRCVSLLTRLLVPLVPKEYLVQVQGSIRLFGNSEPEPDLALVYDRGPGTMATEADVPLVIEVSDTTLATDRRDKLTLYAVAGIPETWLVNLVAGEVERHTEPHGVTYTVVARARAGETLESTVVGGIRIPMSDILG